MNSRPPTRDGGTPPGQAYPDSAGFFRFVTVALLLGALASLRRPLSRPDKPTQRSGKEPR